MQKILRFSFAIATLFNLSLTAQTSTPLQPVTFNGSPVQNRGCGSGILPQQFETWVQNITPSQSKFSGGQIQSVFNIPVIVHVIHNNEAINSTTATSGGNLSTAQILSQIAVLNNDYNGMNADTSLIPSAFKPVQGKFQFNFCLAVVNPTGGVLATPGIDRIDRNTKGWTAPPYSMTYIDATIKPNSIWDPTRYMNMWVCGISGGILGYATFPNPGTSGLSGLSAPYGSTTTDGLVMLNTAFGNVGTAAASAPYNLGRTATHEIGHWLGLRHIWGDNGQCGATDYCNDTPPQRGGTSSPAGCNYGCPTYPLNANTCTLSGQSNINGDMFMNYMDYTNDACMYMFTKDQKVRAQLIMTNSPMRASLLTSTVCNTPTVTNEIGILYVTNPTYSQVINCQSSVTPSVMLFNFGSNTITSATFSYNLNGTGTQTMSWTGTIVPSGSVNVTMPSLNGLMNGNYIYNVGVYAPNGGSDPYLTNNINNQYFSIAGQVSVNVSSGATVCPGNCATLTASGSASAYTWMPGSISTSAAVLCPTIPTIYTVTASNGTCVATKTVNVAVSSGLSVLVNTMSVCSGNSAVLTASGATSYTWSTGATTSSIIVSPSISTTYSVVGSNGSCNGVAITTVGVNTTPSVNITTNGSGCSGTAYTITASGASTYSWNSGATTNAIVLSPVTAGIYTVTGSNGSCSTIKTVTVSIIPSPTVSFCSATQTLCQGSSLAIPICASGASSYTFSSGLTLSSGSVVVSPATTTSYSVIASNGVCTSSVSVITVSVMSNPTVIAVASQTAVCTGGSASLTATGANTYSWNTGATSANIVVTPISSSVYTVTGYNTAGCFSSATVTVAVTTSTINLSLSSSANTLCSGSSAIITANGASSYVWNTGATTNSILVSPSTTTTYSVNASNGSCNGSSAITLTVGATPTISVNNQTICPGGTALLTASGAQTYTWSNGSLFQSISVSPTVATTYSVLGMANNGCVNSNTVSVNIGTSLSVFAVASPSALCPGGTSTITASGASSYTWSNGSNASFIVVSPSVTTTYSLIGASGTCTGSGNGQITVSQAPILSITSNPSGSICSGSSATLSATGASTYLWNTGGTGNSIIVTPTANSVYTVTGTIGGCSATATLALAVGNGGLSIQVNANPPSLCTGGTATISASGASSYLWNTGSTAAFIVVSPSVTSTYSVSGISGSCQGNAITTISVNTPPPLTITASPASTVCQGKTAVLNVSGSYQNFVWASPGYTGASIAVTPASTTIYTVVASGGSSACSKTQTVSIYVSANPVSQIASTSSGCGTVCSGAISATTSGGKQPYTYSVSGGSCSGLPCNNLCPGLYTLYTIDSLGCNSFNIFTIGSALNTLAAAISSTNASCASCADGILAASISGGTPPYTYNWLPSGGNGPIAANLSSGCYTLTTSDAKGCSISNKSCVGVFTGLSNLSANEADLMIYPNPALDKVFVHFSGLFYDITLFDALGQSIYSQKHLYDTAELVTESFTKGVYLIEVKVADRVFRKKLLLE